jgi:hypothetical protein
MGHRLQNLLEIGTRSLLGFSGAMVKDDRGCTLYVLGSTHIVHQHEDIDIVMMTVLPIPYCVPAYRYEPAVARRGPR